MTELYAQQMKNFKDLKKKGNFCVNSQHIFIGWYRSVVFYSFFSFLNYENNLTKISLFFIHQPVWENWELNLWRTLINDKNFMSKMWQFFLGISIRNWIFFTQDKKRVEIGSVGQQIRIFFAWSNYPIRVELPPWF